MVGPMTQKLVWISIILFPVFVPITQFFDFWVMSYENWKHILAIFNFHNYVSNDIFVIKQTWRDPLVRSAAPFDPFFSFLLLGSVSSFSLLFFFFFIFAKILSVRSSFFFWFFITKYFQSSILSFFLFFFFFFFFHWVRVSRFLFFFSSFSSSSSYFTGFGEFWVSSFFFFFFTGFDEFGYLKKKNSYTEWQVWGPQTVWKILSNNK